MKTIGGDIPICHDDISRVGAILDGINAESVLLVTHPEAYENSGAGAKLRDALSSRRVLTFSSFEPNPKLPDAEVALDLLRANPCDAVIAVGGGSAIDMAKLVCLFAAQETSPRNVIENLSHLNPRTLPFIAIPTTAGTGSEATHFAVVYVDGRKTSIPHQSLLPDFAILDPELTRNLPRNLTAVTGLDALCQGIESLWSVQSTDASKTYAREAVRLAWTQLASAVRRPTDESRSAMCRASHLAGRAINISKTTAPHAISYFITSHCGVPHGHAVALTLGPMLIYNSGVNADDVGDPRGVSYVRGVLEELLGILGCSTVEEGAGKFSQLMDSIGCPTTLRELGQTDADILRRIADNVNLERLNNNPRNLGRGSLDQLLEQIR